ncbi:MAG: prenyltransferase/squalene oxidase repeat-containing protein [Planctomycetota bacterium]|nr:prenyltransferase/squalene oxidase repeat-containing protein [Planctomycetota bacterium]
MAARTTHKIAAAILLTPILIVLAAGPASAQGTPFKREIDGLIRFFRDAAAKDHSLADGTCLQTAMVLTAMGHCHRFYSLQDGPPVRNPANFLFTRRQQDGSFVDPAGDAVETTRWVIDALRILEPDTFSQEIEDGVAWLKSRTKHPSAFATLEVSDQEIQAIAGRVAGGPIKDADGKLDMNASVKALVRLVKGQADLRSAKSENKAPTPKVTWSESQQRGFDFLLSKQDHGKFFMMQPIGEDKFMKIHNLGLTGMGIASLQTKPAELRTKHDQAIIDQGLSWLAENQNANGSFGQENLNYTTCASILALVRAEQPSFKDKLKRAQRYILGIQNTEGRSYQPGDRDYGSFGYGGDVRGDLSNSQFAVEALRKTELAADHEALAKAIVFLQRTQNLRKSNDFSGKTKDSDGSWQRTTSGDDGGSAYYPGNSPAGYVELANGTKIPRSYGSMTYALLKTYTLCGVEANDPRIKAAVGWIKKNWNLDVNPGSDPKLPEKFKFQGLYYYYMVMAQALDTVGIENLQIGEGDKAEKIDWRKSLRTKLQSLQSKDGGWVNGKNGRWWESSDLVCATYAMLALEKCR